MPAEAFPGVIIIGVIEGQSAFSELYSRDASGSLAPLGATQDCDSFIPGSRCRLAADDLPGVFSQPGVPDELIFQPGAKGVVIGFLAPQTGRYRINYTARLLDAGSPGVDIGEGFGFVAAPHIGDVSLLLPAVQAAREAGRFMAANSGFFVAFTSRGNPAFDRIGVSMSATAIPEPANWAMLIAGFGLTGAAMRRRRVAALAV